MSGRVGRSAYCDVGMGRAELVPGRKGMGLDSLCRAKESMYECEVAVGAVPK